MKITCECLVDSKTGLPLVLDFPNHTKEDLTEIRTRAWEAGQRFRLGLLASEPKGRLNIDLESIKEEMFKAGQEDRELIKEMLDEQMEDCSQPSTVRSTLKSLGNWLNADKKALSRSTNDPLAEFAKMSAERAIANGFGLSREAFQEIWDQTLGQQSNLET
jgi:hypothetical protein